MITLENQIDRPIDRLTIEQTILQLKWNNNYEKIDEIRLELFKIDRLFIFDSF